MCPFRKAFPLVLFLHLLLVVGIFVGYAQHSEKPSVFTVLPAIGVGEETQQGSVEGDLTEFNTPPTPEKSPAPNITTQRVADPERGSEASLSKGKFPSAIIPCPPRPASVPSSAGSVAANTPAPRAIVGGAVACTDVGQKIIPPIALKKTKPIRPTGAAKGEVVLTFTINVSGLVESAKVESSPSEAMTAAVMAVLPKWRFVPAKENGQSLSISVKQVVEF